MKINLRTESGWNGPVENKSKETCDRCGAKLWSGPGGPYCDAVHAREAVEIKAGDVMVCSWGYSMTLVTFVRVEKVSKKTILVRELQHRGISEEERVKHGLPELSYLQLYSLPKEELALHNGGPQKPIRLYPCKGILPDTWFTAVNGYKKFFKLWDGRPEYENHCD